MLYVTSSQLRLLDRRGNQPSRRTRPAETTVRAADPRSIVGTSASDRGWSVIEYVRDHEHVARVGYSITPRRA